MIIEEAEALRAALGDFSSAPQPGCPRELDDRAWSNDAAPQAEGRRRLLHLTQHQAVLIYVNAYDHLLTLGRMLGGDGAMSLFSQASTSRVVCEAAVRFAWLLDSAIGNEERIMRGAVALLASAEERLRGAMRIPAGQFDPRLRQALIDNCTAERDSAQALITGAGMTVAPSRDGKRPARLELDSPRVSVPVKLDVTELMGALLPESPTWYNISSGVTHSHYWGLRDAVASPGDEPLALTPDLLEVGAAAESAISASGLIIARAGAYYGHDPQTHLQRTRERRKAIDLHMRRIGAARWARHRNT